VLHECLLLFFLPHPCLVRAVGFPSLAVFKQRVDDHVVPGKMGKEEETRICLQDVSVQTHPWEPGVGGSETSRCADTLPSISVERVASPSPCGQGGLPGEGGESWEPGRAGWLDLVVKMVWAENHTSSCRNGKECWESKAESVMVRKEGRDWALEGRVGDLGFLLGTDEPWKSVKDRVNFSPSDGGRWEARTERTSSFAGNNFAS
jgi:hypothetical protein